MMSDKTAELLTERWVDASPDLARVPTPRRKPATPGVPDAGVFDLQDPGVRNAIVDRIVAWATANGYTAQIDEEGPNMQVQILGAPFAIGPVSASKSGGAQSLGSLLADILRYDALPPDALPEANPFYQPPSILDDAPPPTIPPDWQSL